MFEWNNIFTLFGIFEVLAWGSWKHFTEVELAFLEAVVLLVGGGVKTQEILAAESVFLF